MSTDDTDSFDLERFTDAQAGVYDTVTAELRAGRKRSHWIWFVFPQLRGLGHSATAYRFGLTSLDEAVAYLGHPVLGPRLQECAELLLDHRDRTARDILGYPDDLKVRSSMTLFARAGGGSVCTSVLDAFYGGEEDAATLELLR
ncbi:DUF1810 domain-containing protein [Mycolicibacterium sp. 018/SC-01/001]|uniref:DUF1810 domain-containing protein n=1 Tax=Mycolicibacterium sp. 018/SC-01/001 TaxID=2592069 RepID=UPI001180FF56|nr:DUF1810 domain-containing protein [Mycolicibacterium sp. 018/SC-01/001]TRW82420.1 DUF1810 domain-containing protein [Mycolicibacterium sp. 018/SC-01/001]